MPAASGEFEMFRGALTLRMQFKQPEENTRRTCCQSVKAGKNFTRWANGLDRLPPQILNERGHDRLDGISMFVLHQLPDEVSAVNESHCDEANTGKSLYPQHSFVAEFSVAE